MTMPDLTSVPTHHLVTEIIRRAGGRREAVKLLGPGPGRPAEDDEALVDKMYVLIEIDRTERTPHAAAKVVTAQLPEHLQSAVRARLQRKYKRAGKDLGPVVHMVGTGRIHHGDDVWTEVGTQFEVKHAMAVDLIKARAAREFDSAQDRALPGPIYDLTNS